VDWEDGYIVKICWVSLFRLIAREPWRFLLCLRFTSCWWIRINSSKW